MSRWATEKYSRSERQKRALGCHISGQSRLTAYYPILNDVEICLKSKDEMIESLSAKCKELAECVSHAPYKGKNIPYLLQILMETAIKNSAREKHGNRYEMEIKYFATYLFIIGGPMVYEFLYNNFTDALPSASQVERTMAISAAPVQEGYFRFIELKEFLTMNNLPMKVWISEDGTRINQKFLFDVKSNQIIGPAPPLAANGVPLLNSFPASSAAMIASHFERATPSSSAYAIMAQALEDGAPSFCLCIFGTDNKFTSEQVYKRWFFIAKELGKLGIEVIGFASDGDPKLLTAMLSQMFTKNSAPYLEELKDFYFATNGSNFTVMQDFIHTVNKFRSRLCPANLLPLGNYTASQAHLRMLIHDRPKEEHGLTISDLDTSDKMNFNASIKICSERVTNLLEEHVSGSAGTIAYLTMMRHTMEAGLDESISPVEKIYKIWLVCIFFRYWKNWLVVNPCYSLDNFISRNLYMCVEIIAHAIIYLIVKFRDENCPSSLLIHLFTSQACESFFRYARSMTSTQSTVINFAVKELLEKIRRIDMLHNVSSKLSSKFAFPREKRKRLLGVLTSEKLKSTYLPNNEEIRTVVLKANEDAISILRKLGIESLTGPTMKRIKGDLLLGRNLTVETEADTHALDGYQADIDDDDIPLSLLRVFPCSDSITDLNPNEENGACARLPSQCNFVVVPDGKGGYKHMTKSLFCWLLSSVGSNLSSDRLQRVRSKVYNSFSCNINLSESESVSIAKKNTLAVGDWCLFKVQSCLNIGQVLGFAYLTGKGKSRTYSLLTAPIEPPEGVVGRGLGVLCMWYTHSGEVLNPKHVAQHEYININNYVSTIPDPKPTEAGLIICKNVLSFVEHYSVSS